MAGEEAYLDRAIGRYSPTVAATARAALGKLRARFPGARQSVYERRQSLPIGFAPAARGSAVFSLVLYPRWVRFFFLDGATLVLKSTIPTSRDGALESAEQPPNKRLRSTR